MGFKIFVGDHTLINWISKQLKTEFSPTDSCFGICDDSGKILAAVCYNYYCPPNIELSIASVSPKWATRKFIHLALTYPFMQLGCNRITTRISKYNKKTKRLAERMGFKSEGALREAGKNGETLIIYGYLKKEFLRSKWHVLRITQNTSST